MSLDGPEGTQIWVHNITVNNNIGEGIDVFSVTDTDNISVFITDSVVLENGDDSVDSAGVLVDGAGGLTVQNLMADNNRGPGLAVIDMINTQISDARFTNNGVIDGLPGIFLISASTFDVTRSVFTGNGEAGIDVLPTSLIGNELTSIAVNCSEFTGNDYGLFLSTNAAASGCMHSTSMGSAIKALPPIMPGSTTTPSMSPTTGGMT
nr:right-handed parallel beta-helix repeat-containing protein [Marinicella sp. NBU2979]